MPPSRGRFSAPRQRSAIIDRIVGGSTIVVNLRQAGEKLPSAGLLLLASLIGPPAPHVASLPARAAPCRGKIRSMELPPASQAPGPRAEAVAWSLVIPVKVLAQAKSRLAGLARPPRAELALAMAADTVAAALAAGPVRDVIVVTDDEVVGAELRGLGAVVIADEPASGLNPALLHGASYADARWPGRGRAAMAGDLPALRPAELALALAAA